MEDNGEYKLWDQWKGFFHPKKQDVLEQLNVHIKNYYRYMSGKHTTTIIDNQSIDYEIIGSINTTDGVELCKGVIHSSRNDACHMTFIDSLETVVLLYEAEQINFGAENEMTIEDLLPAGWTTYNQSPLYVEGKTVINKLLDETTMNEESISIINFKEVKFNSNVTLGLMSLIIAIVLAPIVVRRILRWVR